MEVAKRCPRFPPFPDRHHDALAMLVLHLLGWPSRDGLSPELETEAKKWVAPAGVGVKQRNVGIRHGRITAYE